MPAPAINRRYALASSLEAGLPDRVWSTGGAWVLTLPDSGSLLTGPEADALAAANPQAAIIDVVVYRQILTTYFEAFNAVAADAAHATPDLLERAHVVAREALYRAGFRLAAARRNPLDPLER